MIKQIFFFFTFLLFATPLTLLAESSMWNQVLDGRYYKDSVKWQWGIVLDNPLVTVEMRSRIVDTDTGTVVPCGSTVSKNTNLQLQFVPHTYTDTSWVGTGSTMDSPYGEWATGAAEPPVGSRCIDKNFATYVGPANGNSLYTYIAYVVNPPTKTFSNLSSLGCTINGTEANCTLPNTGTFNPTFNFAETNSHLFGYYDLDGCYGGGMYKLTNMDSPYGERSASDNNPDNITVPAQTISCSITVVDPGPAPTPPTLYPVGSCLINSPMQISIVATDPNGKQIKYAVDWDANGTIDQFLPSTGYVNSGITQIASRTYINTATYNPRVKTINISGATSAWTQASFSCEKSCQTATNVCGQAIETFSENGICSNTINTTEANASCITTFNVTSQSITPNGSVEFSWKVPENVNSKCGFYDYTTPTPRPIPGLQNLDTSVDNARITNIQTTTRFCLVCQFYNATTNASLGDAIAHQWIRVIRVGEN